jgi:hypothetical protein
MLSHLYLVPKNIYKQPGAFTDEDDDSTAGLDRIE